MAQTREDAYIEQPQQIIFEPVEAFELGYERISCKLVGGEDDGRLILKPCTGSFSPNTFTAILGPTGCGKTTMLNLISGRQISDNIQAHGKLLVNGEATDNIGNYKNYIGYVQQEDHMLPTFTPKEAFRFVVDLRLPNLSEKEKERRVENIILNLGLSKCKNTWVGDTRIRGVSGGERKRTSIGLELLINPSIIFLDQPTTGLDSTNALKLIGFLNKLAKKGRTIISTIHQPSSKIFAHFDRIMLMVDGHIIYDGKAGQSMAYFARLRLGVPLHSNPADHYMRLLNKEGMMVIYIQQGLNLDEEAMIARYGKHVQMLIQNYKGHFRKYGGNRATQGLRALDTSDVVKAGWKTEFKTIFMRNWKNQFRQPLDVILKIVQSVVFGALCIILYYQKGTNFYQIAQNNQGCLFYMILSTCFAYIFSSVNLFNFERPVFIRERLSNTYSTSAYYFGRTLAVLPVQVLTCFLFLAVCYFPCNLDNSAGVFFKTLLSLQMCAFISSAFGLLLSTVFADAAVVMALVPILIVPFLLVSGFFVPLQKVSKVYYPFEYLSMFRYGFQSIIYSQYQNNPLIIDGYPMPVEMIGTKYKFEVSFAVDLILMGVIALFIRAVALVVMYFISNPKTKDLVPSNQILEQVVAEIQSNQPTQQDNREEITQNLGEINNFASQGDVKPNYMGKYIQMGESSRAQNEGNNIRSRQINLSASNNNLSASQQAIQIQPHFNFPRAFQIQEIELSENNNNPQPFNNLNIPFEDMQ